jgi:putative glutamine amidotransferase
MSEGARPLIFLTQRVEHVVSYGERRDALDQVWVRLLDEIGCDGLAIANHVPTALSLADRFGPDLIILTGGNGVMPGCDSHAMERNATEAALLDWAAQSGRPAFGVCRGFQLMNVYLGGALRPVEGHVACTHATDLADGAIGRVNSYHNLGIMSEDLASAFKAAAKAPDGSIEAAQHRRLPWAGIMWHPERPMPDASGSRCWFAAAMARIITRKAVFDLD